MKPIISIIRAVAATALVTLGGCVTSAEVTKPQATVSTLKDEKFEKDRQAILAMSGNYRVKFDFIETASFVDGYKLKDRKLSGADEIVRVIEDDGDYISLQHILVVGGKDKFAIKHWRQDWRYQPESVLIYVGGNAWEKRPLSAAQSKGKWSQVVYQVDDSPRYGALAAWAHDDGISQWTPPREWRPLPRRDATTRNDYHAVNAVNRHAITPFGWVHEQDNSKLILSGEPQTLVREIAINTYKKFDDFDIAVGDDYWRATKEYWAGIRAEWSQIEIENEKFGLSIQGETQALYGEILLLANDVNEGTKTKDEAIDDARGIIRSYLKTEIGPLASRIGK